MPNSPEAVRPLLQKVAVITGASRGIGLALAQRLAAAGCNLALCARNTKFISEQDLAERHGVRVLVRECDVRSAESVTAFFEAVRARFGGLDFLINNAGLAGPMATVERVTLDD